MQQPDTQYDGDGNPILIATRLHYANDSMAGPLGTPTAEPYARVYYVAYWYDAAGRPTAEADVGTNGGAAYVRPGAPPAASDTTLLTTWSYNPAGLLADTTDPRGLDTHDNYDALGRLTQEISAYTGNAPSNNSDQTTNYTYDGDGHVINVTAVLVTSYDAPSGGPGPITAFPGPGLVCSLST